MYERFDGKGFPDGQAGKDIPLGARILAIGDTYADLTQNPRNPYRKIARRPTRRCDVLCEAQGDHLRSEPRRPLPAHVVLGEDLKAPPPRQPLRARSSSIPTPRRRPSSSSA